MKNLLTAIYGKFASSALSTDVGGRIYLDRAPDGCEFPYVVYFIVSGVPEKTFTEEYSNVIIQFSLFSASEGATEITTMYADLKSLFDECALTITGSTLVWMKLNGLQTMIEDITTATGAQQVRHYAVDFEIFTALN